MPSSATRFTAARNVPSAASRSPPNAATTGQPSNPNVACVPTSCSITPGAPLRTRSSAASGPTRDRSVHCSAKSFTASPPAFASASATAAGAVTSKPPACTCAAHLPPSRSRGAPRPGPLAMSASMSSPVAPAALSASTAPGPASLKTLQPPLRSTMPTLVRRISAS